MRKFLAAFQSSQDSWIPEDQRKATRIFQSYVRPSVSKELVSSDPYCWRDRPMHLPEGSQIGHFLQHSRDKWSIHFVVLESVTQSCFHKLMENDLEVEGMLKKAGKWFLTNS